jgi:hypothetical protein
MGILHAPPYHLGLCLDFTSEISNLGYEFLTRSYSHMPINIKLNQFFSLFLFQHLCCDPLSFAHLDQDSRPPLATHQNNLIQVDIGGHPPIPTGSKQFLAIYYF